MNPEKDLKTLQEEFLGHVSHEFRSPLTAVKGYVDLLLRCEDKLTSRQEQYAKGIQQGLHRLRFFIDNLMDITQLRALDTVPLGFKVGYLTCD